MRRILIDRARARKYAKRGGGAVTVEAEQISNIWIARNNDARRARQITNTKSDISSNYVCFTPDGCALAYLDQNHASNIISQSVDSGAKKQLTHFNGDFISALPGHATAESWPLRAVL